MVYDTGTILSWITWGLFAPLHDYIENSSTDNEYYFYNK